MSPLKVPSFLGSTSVDWDGFSETITRAPQIIRSKLSSPVRLTPLSPQEQKLKNLTDAVRNSAELLLRFRQATLKNCTSFGHLFEHNHKMYRAFQETFSINELTEGNPVSSELIRDIENEVAIVQLEVDGFAYDFKTRTDVALDIFKKVFKVIRHHEYLELDVSRFRRELATLAAKQLLTSNEHERRMELEQRLGDASGKAEVVKQLLTTDLPPLLEYVRVIFDTLTTNAIYFQLGLHYRLYNLAQMTMSVQNADELSYENILGTYRAHHEEAHMRFEDLKDIRHGTMPYCNQL